MKTVKKLYKIFEANKKSPFAFFATLFPKIFYFSPKFFLLKTQVKR